MNRNGDGLVRIPTGWRSYLGPLATADIYIGVRYLVGKERLGTFARVSTAGSVRN